MKLFSFVLISIVILLFITPSSAEGVSILNSDSVFIGEQDLNYTEIANSRMPTINVESDNLKIDTSHFEYFSENFTNKSEDASVKIEEGTVTMVSNDIQFFTTSDSVVLSGINTDSYYVYLMIDSSDSPLQGGRLDNPNLPVIDLDPSTFTLVPVAVDPKLFYQLGSMFRFNFFSSSLTFFGTSVI